MNIYQLVIRLQFSILIMGMSGEVFGQIKVNTGTTINISSGTNVFLNGGSNSLVIESNSILINHGTIHLGDSAIIYETLGFPITGSGEEITTRNFSAPLINENIGGLGAEITTAIAPGLLTISRTHENFFDSLQNPGIKRAYKFNTSNGSLNAILKFRYDSTELNNLGEAGLVILESNDNGSSWISGGGTPYPSMNLVALSSIDSLGFYTVFMNNNTISNNSSTLCETEQFQVFINSTEGIGSANNYILQLSDVNGSFSSPTNIGSIQSNQSGNVSATVPSGIIAGSNYRIRVLSTDPVLFGVPSQPLEIRILPDIPSPPIGLQTVCNDIATQFVTSGSLNANTYNWYLDPPNAGSISGSGDSIMIAWDTSYTGIATLGVTGVNDCGESESSNTTIELNYCVGIVSTAKQELILSPNPANEFLDIYNAPPFVKYVIYSPTGELVKEGYFTTTNFRIQLSFLPSGLYYLYLLDSKSNQSIKFIIR